MELRRQTLQVLVAEIFFAEIEAGLGKGEGLQDGRTQRLDSRGKASLQAGQSRACLGLAAGMDEIGNRLRLRQIQALVEKRALTELAGPSRPRALAHGVFEQGAEDDRAAVTLQLHHVLAGVTMRRGKIQGDAMVDLLPWRQKELPEIGVARAPGFVLGQAAERIGNRQRIRAGQTENADAADPGGVAMATMLSPSW